MLHLCKIGHSYYYRARIPADLLKFFPCPEVKKTLRTQNPKIAKVLVKSLAFQTERVFALIRSKLLTDEQIKKLVNDFFKDTLRECEEYRALGLGVPTNEDELDDMLENHDLFIPEYREALAYNKFETVEPTVDWLLEEHSFSLDKGSSEYKRLCREMLKAQIDILAIERQRLIGNYSNEYDNGLGTLSTTYSGHDANKTEQEGKLLSVVIEEYVKEHELTKSWNPKTKDENLSIYALFRNILMFITDEDDIDIAALDRKMLIEYTRILSKLPPNLNKKRELKGRSIGEVLGIADKKKLNPMGISTSNKYIHRVSSLFGWCVKQGHLARNPAEGLSAKDKRKEHEQRDAYSREDIERLFVSPVYSGKALPDKPERFWIPLIALYSGMRLNEICQLYLEDVREFDGVWCFDINNKMDKKLKTPSSERIVPIHPVLVEVDFLQYVEKLRSQGKERLWENLELKRDGYGSDFGKWYQRYNREHITKNPKRVFHSFRHSFINNLKQKGVPGAVIAELSGHAHDSIDMGRYGKRYEPEVRFEAVKGIDYQIDVINMIKRKCKP